MKAATVQFLNISAARRVWRLAVSLKRVECDGVTRL
jgi:hypothetical protein